MLDLAEKICLCWVYSVLMSLFPSPLQACPVSLRLLKIRQASPEGWRPLCVRRSGSPSHASPGWRRARKSVRSALRCVCMPDEEMRCLCTRALIRCDTEHHVGDLPASCQLLFNQNTKSNPVWKTKRLPLFSPLTELSCSQASHNNSASLFD